MLKKLNAEIAQHGLPHFLRSKFTEQYYKYKFKGLLLDYKASNTTIEVLNTRAENRDSKINQASSYYDLKKAFILSGIEHPNICLLDIGCGNGKVLSFGMYLNCMSVVGVDLDPSAISSASINCGKMKEKGSKTMYKLHEEDAGKFSIPNEINVIYLFNPFGKNTMQLVTDNIFAHHAKNKKDLCVVYTVPVHQDLFITHEGCSKIYERLNGAKTKAEMAVFKIHQN